LHVETNCKHQWTQLPSLGFTITAKSGIASVNATVVPAGRFIELIRDSGNAHSHHGRSRREPPPILLVRGALVRSIPTPEALQGVFRMFGRYNGGPTYTLFAIACCYRLLDRARPSRDDGSSNTSSGGRKIVPTAGFSAGVLRNQTTPLTTSKSCPPWRRMSCRHSGSFHASCFAGLQNAALPAP